jgi:hypothetical protein
MNSTTYTVLTFLTGQCGRAARTYEAERRTKPDDHRSELLSSVGVGGGASRRFSEFVGQTGNILVGQLLIIRIASPIAS